MELSAEARTILERAYRFNDATSADREEVETLVKRMPEDRVLLYKNVESNPIGDLPRYSIHIRIQHMIIFVTFLALAFTGLPIKYFDSFWADWVNQIAGGVDISRIVHRTLALAMIFGMLYHMVSITFGVVVSFMRGRFEVERTVIPVWKDLSDFREDLLYFSGKRDQRPEMDKFMYKQKLHYFAAAFGNFVMITSGSTFLFPEVWAAILPEGFGAQFQEFMRLSHPHEALLALLVIAFWHWYNVHLAPGRFPMQWTFLTGKITREHQIEEHFLEYLRNLVEIPEERAYLRSLLDQSELEEVGKREETQNSQGSDQPETKAT